MVKKQKNFAEMPKLKKATHGGRLMLAALEEKLVDWILKLRINEVIITRTAIWIRALNLMKTLEFSLKKPVNFIASSGAIGL